MLPFEKLGTAASLLFKNMCVILLQWSCSGIIQPFSHWLTIDEPWPHPLHIYIYIPWPFPPAWGVADNTKETTKTIVRGICKMTWQWQTITQTRCKIWRPQTRPWSSFLPGSVSKLYWDILVMLLKKKVNINRAYIISNFYMKNNNQDDIYNNKIFASLSPNFCIHLATFHTPYKEKRTVKGIHVCC